MLSFVDEGVNVVQRTVVATETLSFESVKVTGEEVVASSKEEKPSSET
jgi:hypothetical protein